MNSQIISIQPAIQPIIPESSLNHGRAFVKLLLLILFPFFLTAVSTVVAVRYFTQNNFQKADQEILLSFPMQETNWQDLGNVVEPLIPLQVKTKNGYKDNKFLLDSGAVVSSLPREWAKETGQDLSFLPRSTFKGFGGTTSFAYQGEMVLLLGEDKDVAFPVVFTEAIGTKSLLGRKGFFENYSIYFNHKERKIEIRK